jgi:hypothetical protein
MHSTDGHLLRIYIGEKARHGRAPLYEWIVHQAQEQGLAGATVLRGLEGFGADSRIHTSKALRLATDLPIIVEIVDTREKIDAFLSEIEKSITGGLATIEKVEVHWYRDASGS